MVQTRRHALAGGQRLTIELARNLYESGRCHALSSSLLYRSAIKDGESRDVADPELFAFNGPYSLSMHLLLGLGLELMLKAAILAWNADADSDYLRDEVGHDLTKALGKAMDAGFKSKAPNLDRMVEVLHQPYKEHWFRYERPEQMALPGDYSEIIEALDILDRELESKLRSDR